MNIPAESQHTALVCPLSHPEMTNVTKRFNKMVWISIDFFPWDFLLVLILIVWYIFYELSWSVMEYDFFYPVNKIFSIRGLGEWIENAWIGDWSLMYRCTSTILFMTALTMLSDCNIQSQAFQPRIPPTPLSPNLYLLKKK